MGAIHYVTSSKVWVFRLKVGPNRLVERHKARLVAQGFSQKQGLHYDETFSPVVRFDSLRTVIALAVQNSMIETTPDGCYNSIPEWRVARRCLHEAARSLLLKPCRDRSHPLLAQNPFGIVQCRVAAVW